MGTVKVNVGNGNRIGNSRIIDELKKIPSDSIIDFDKLNLDLFKDLNFEISNHLEITNGLSVGLGFMFHRRTPAEHPEESFRQVELPENVAEGLQANIRPQYNSFAPRIRVEWTPGQYYYMNGRQKINLKSRFPTFIVDYERGLRNIFKVQAFMNALNSTCNTTSVRASSPTCITVSEWDCSPIRKKLIS